MTVNPGFGGQTFIPRSTSKVRAMRALLDEAGNAGADRGRRRHRRADDRRASCWRARTGSWPGRRCSGRAMPKRRRASLQGPGRGRGPAAPGGAPERPLSAHTSAALVRVRYAETDKMGVRLLRELPRVVRSRPLRAGCGRWAGPTARWKTRTGRCCPSSKRIVSIGCRRDTMMSWRSVRRGQLLSPVRIRFEYEVVRRSRRRGCWPRATRCTPPRIWRAAPATAGPSEGLVRMKALVTGVAGFIGSHAGRAAAGVRRRA